MFCILSPGIHLLLFLILGDCVYARGNNKSDTFILANINNSTKVEMYSLPHLHLIFFSSHLRYIICFLLGAGILLFSLESHFRR